MPNTDVPLIWIAFGGLVTLCVSGFSLLWGSITGVRKEDRDDRTLIWKELNTMKKEQGAFQIEHAGSTASRTDLYNMRTDLENGLDKRLKLSEVRFADIVRYEILNALTKKQP